MKRSESGASSTAPAALWIIAIVATLFLLRAASQLLIPIILAVLLSYALEPVVAWLVRHRVPRPAGTTLVLLVLLGLVGWGGYSVRDNVTQVLDSLPEAARRVREMVLSQGGSGPGASIHEAAQVLAGGAPPNAQGKQDAEEQEDVKGKTDASPAGTSPAQGGATTMTGLLQQGVASLIALAGNLVVVVFLVFFLLLSGPRVRNRILEITGPRPEDRRTAAIIIDELNAQIQRFLLVRLVTAVIVGAATWGVLAWMGVQNAAVWGILAGVFNSIPYFGPLIVSVGLLVVGMAQGGGVAHALQMSGAALVITSLEGWLLTPPLMGKAERMSALAVFLGLLLWTWIWGAWGTILGVPMLVVVKSVADRVERLKPLGRLLAS
jgi:predicted PurR-regulated permease PerM